MTVRPYQVFLHERLLTTTPRSGRNRAQIMAFVRGLAEDPFQQPDYHEVRAGEHPVLVKLVGRYAVSYVVDHAVREVKVVGIEAADGADPG